MSSLSVFYFSGNSSRVSSSNPLKCTKPVVNTKLKSSFNDTSATAKQRYSSLVKNTSYTTVFPFRDFDIMNIPDGNLGYYGNGTGNYGNYGIPGYYNSFKVKNNNNLCQISKLKNNSIS